MSGNFTYIAGQGIGIVALIVSVIGYLQSNEKKLKFINANAALLETLSYFLLGAYTGANMTFVIAIRNFITAKNNSKKLFPLFIIFFILTGIYSYREIYDILPIFGSIAGTTAYFYLTGKNLRYVLIAAGFAWLAYAIVAFSIGQMMIEISILLSNLYALWRLKKGIADELIKQNEKQLM